MSWLVRIVPEFQEELRTFDREVRKKLLGSLKLLEVHGPRLGRPYVDTLKGSRYANLKELRFDVGKGVWRAAFAFDTTRVAVLLAAGDKSGVGKDRFYRQLIATADARYARHLERLNEEKAEKNAQARPNLSVKPTGPNSRRSH